MTINPIDLITYALSCLPLWWRRNHVRDKRSMNFQAAPLLIPIPSHIFFLPRLQKRPPVIFRGEYRHFPLKPEYERRLWDPPGGGGGSGGIGVEYYSMCISLALGSLNDAVGNIKSSVALRALIWIVKTTSAVDGNQREGNVRSASNRLWNWSMNIWSAGEWCTQWRMISLGGFFVLKSAFSWAAFVTGPMKACRVRIVCIMNLMCAGRRRPGSTRSSFSSRKWDRDLPLKETSPFRRLWQITEMQKISKL